VTGSDGFLRLRAHARLLINARFWRQFHPSRLRRRSPHHPMHELLRKAVVALLTRLAFAFGLLGVSGAIVIVMGQCFSWLEFDRWPEITVIHGITALGWSIPATWLGGKAISIVLNLPLSVVVLTLGLALRQLFARLAGVCRLKEEQA